MNAGWFQTYHEIPELLQVWLSGLGVRDAERGARDLVDLTRRAGPERLDRVARIAEQLDAVLPKCPDPGMALANLERFLAAVRRLDETLDQLVGEARTTEILLHVFSTSQYFSEVLIRDPGLFDWLRAGAERRDRSALVEELWETVSALDSEEDQKLAFRRFRRRESLRIGYNDIVRGFPLEVITQDLSYLADACAEAAVRLARAHAEDEELPDEDAVVSDEGMEMVHQPRAEGPRGIPIAPLPVVVSSEESDGGMEPSIVEVATVTQGDIAPIGGINQGRG